MGHFANAVPVRLKVQLDGGLTTLLQETQAACSRAYALGRMPIELLAADPEIGIRSALRRVAVSYQNFPVPNFELAGAELECWDVPDLGAAQTDLTITSREWPEGIRGWLTYDTSRLAGPFIQMLADRLPMFIESSCSSVATPIEDLKFDEPAPIAAGEVSSTSELPTALFAAHVRQQPEATAVCMAGEALSYCELARRAVVVADHLRSLGVERGDRVVVCLERSIHMIVALLGIWEAGAAYVPVSPDDPIDRVSHVIADVAARSVIAQSETATCVRAPDVSLLLLDRDVHWGDAGSSREYIGSTAGDSLAYVIYTSGSTGQPKGVPIDHSSVAALLASIRQCCELGVGSVWTFLHSLSFDVSVFEIFGCLSTGGVLIVVTQEQSRSPGDLRKLLHQERVAVLSLTPSAFAAFVSIDERASDDLGLFLEYVLLAGEPASSGVLARWFDRHPDECPRVINLYGTTETTVHATFRHVRLQDVRSAVRTPIGGPLKHLAFRVVDRKGRSVPIGVAGELWIAGASVTRGYLGRPDLNAARFVTEADGNRWYRTGDLVREVEAREFVHLGRIDSQVKIRGHRIELEEVERILVEHESVAAAAVVPRSVEGGVEQLVAFLCAREVGEVLSNKGLARHVARRLPEYMRPAHFVQVHDFPITRSGKIDRHELSRRRLSRDASFGDVVSAETPLEERLLVLWAEALGVDRVGVRDDFFDLGGDSLAAVKLSLSIESALGVDIEPRFVLDCPSVRSAARVLARLPSSRRSSRTVRLPCSDALEDVERCPQPLLASIEAGAIAPLDSAAIACLPSDWGADGSEVVRSVDFDEDALALVRETPWGRIGIILLGRAERDAFASKEALHAELLLALRIASRAGARAVSLTGLLASATGDHGVALHRDAVDRSYPAITTGHAATAAAVVLSIQSLLDLSGRRIEDMRVAFLGLGSIGRAVLGLVSGGRAKPREIVLSDLVGSEPRLDRIAQESMRDGFDGRLSIATTRGDAPAAALSCDLIVGATTAGESVDVELVPPGCLIVDDSAPHCFSVAAAARRMKQRGDLLIAEGGVLRVGSKMRRTIHLPPGHDVQEAKIWLAREQAEEITACVLGSLLVATGRLEASVGAATVAASRSAYDLLQKLRIQPARPQLLGEVISAEYAEAFARSFGTVSG